MEQISTGLDIVVANGTAQYELKANNSIQSNQNIDVEINKEILVVKVPVSLFKNATKIMMSSNIKDADKNKLDEMSWREFIFPTDWISTLKNSIKIEI